MTNTNITRQDWRWFMIAQGWAEGAADPHTKVGAVIVPANGTGFIKGRNDPPNGTPMTPTMLARPDKYTWLEHAERTAIQAAARLGVSTEGGTMYSTLHPCAVCARAIIGAGIARLVTPEPDFTRVVSGYEAAMWLFEQCGVQVDYVQLNLNEGQLPC